MRTDLSDGRIFLRRPEPGDVDALYRSVVASKQQLLPWLPWVHENYSREDTEQWLAGIAECWESGEGYPLIMIDPSNASILGGTGVASVDQADRRGALGYWVRSDCAGGGLATSAARLTARFAFEDLDLARIEIIVDCRNAASRRVAEKIGAVQEAVLRSRLQRGAKRYDAFLFSLLPGDLR